MFSSFRDIIGQADIVEKMQSAVRTGRIPHAMLLTGERGIGKKTLAALFARALQCRGEGAKPCGVCTSCRKAASGNHPDILFVTHEKPASIGVDEIRSQLVNDVPIRPYESRYKIYIIDEAEKLTPAAQNAMLKTIEEPPEYAVILLLAAGAETLLPTVLSRCERVDVKPVPDDEVFRYLTEKTGVPEHQAEIQAAFARGNIGRALRLAASPDFAEMVNNAVYLLKRSGRVDTLRQIETVRSMTAEKNNLMDHLEIFRLWFRDVLLFKATRDADGLVFSDELGAIRERAASSGYEGLQTILAAIDTAQARLHANVNPELALELLFLTMKEN